LTINEISAKLSVSNKNYAKQIVRCISRSNADHVTSYAIIRDSNVNM